MTLSWSNLFGSCIMELDICKKRDNYCNQPNEVFGFYEVQESFDPNKPIILNLYLIELFNSGQNKTLYSFTVPAIFERPKGEITKQTLLKHQVIPII